MMAARLASRAHGTVAAGKGLHTVNNRASGPSAARFHAGGSQLLPRARFNGRNGHEAVKAGMRPACVCIAATAVADIKVSSAYLAVRRLARRDA
jgi:hypothetical protein